MDGLKQENRNESNVNLFTERWRDGENNNTIAIHSFIHHPSLELRPFTTSTTHSNHPPFTTSTTPNKSIPTNKPTHDHTLLHSQLIVTISSDVAHPRQRFVSTLLHNLQISHLQSRGSVIRDFKVHRDGTHLVIVLLLHTSLLPSAPTPSSRCTDGRPKWARIWYSRIP